MKTSKKQANYIQLIDNWFIGTDSMNFILLKRRVVKNAAKANSNNLGKEVYDTFGFYFSLSGLASGLLKHLSMDVLKSCGTSTVIDCLKILEGKIGEIKTVTLPGKGTDECNR